MQDEHKSREQLIVELQELREQVAQLESDKAECKQTEEQLLLILDTLPVVIWQKDREGKYLQVNRAFCDTVGLSAETILGRTDYDFFPADFADHYVSSDRRILDSGIFDVCIEEQHQQPSGAQGRYRTHKMPYYDREGHIAGTIGFALDITEQKQREEELRASEEKYRSIIDNAPVGIFHSTLEGKFVAMNPMCAQMMGYDSPEELIAVTNQTSIAEVLYLDTESRSAILKRALDSNGRWVEAETRACHKTGFTKDVRFFFRKIPVQSGQSAVLEGFVEDISEPKRLEFLIRLQRDLAIALGSASSIEEAMERLLGGVMKIDGIDAGGVYLLDAIDGGLRLVSHAGLSSWFVNQVSYYGSETPQTGVVMQGEPLYWCDFRDALDFGTLLEREGLTCVTAIPIKCDGRVVAVANLASRTLNEFHEQIKQTLEAIATSIGGIIFKVRAENTLRVERENLSEANAALKVLLRQRVEDQREFEDALLKNVGKLVTPFVEKFMKTRLTPEQALLLKIIDSNLKEITAPLLGTLSRRFADLTKMEIKVASLVREGRTCKEMASILGISENAILFHRKNVRGKLGLKHKRVNLQSYLSSLPK